MKIAIVISLIIVFIIIMDGIKKDVFLQRKQELIETIISNTNEEEIYMIYVFGKGGNIPSNFNQQIDESVYS